MLFCCGCGNIGDCIVSIDGCSATGCDFYIGDRDNGFIGGLFVCIDCVDNSVCVCKSFCCTGLVLGIGTVCVCKLLFCTGLVLGIGTVCVYRSSTKDKHRLCLQVALLSRQLQNRSW